MQHGASAGFTTLSRMDLSLQCQACKEVLVFNVIPIIASQLFKFLLSQRYYLYGLMNAEGSFKEDDPLLPMESIDVPKTAHQRLMTEEDD
jgi:hypothetical protein